MPQLTDVNKCCFLLPLKFGSLLIALYFIAQSGCCIGGAVYFILNLDKYNIPFPDLPGLQDSIKYVIGIIGGVHIFILLTNIILLIGLIIKKKGIFMFWNVVHTAYTLLFFLLGVTFIIIHFIIDSYSGIVTLVIVIFTTGLNLYFFIIVSNYTRSLFPKKLKEEK